MRVPDSVFSLRGTCLVDPRVTSVSQRREAGLWEGSHRSFQTMSQQGLEKEHMPWAWVACQPQLRSSPRGGRDLPHIATLCNFQSTVPLSLTHSWLLEEILRGMPCWNDSRLESVPERQVTLEEGKATSQPLKKERAIQGWQVCDICSSEVYSQPLSLKAFPLAHQIKSKNKRIPQASSEPHTDANRSW